MNAASDSELVARCRAGDHDAWTLLVDRYARYVHAIVTRVFRVPPADAEDVFQEVFARIFERLGTLRDDDALQALDRADHAQVLDRRAPPLGP